MRRRLKLKVAEWRKFYSSVFLWNSLKIRRQENRKEGKLGIRLSPKIQTVKQFAKYCKIQTTCRRMLNPSWESQPIYDFSKSKRYNTLKVKPVTPFWSCDMLLFIASKKLLTWLITENTVTIFIKPHQHKC